MCRIAFQIANCLQSNIPRLSNYNIVLSYFFQDEAKFMLMVLYGTIYKYLSVFKRVNTFQLESAGRSAD